MKRKNVVIATLTILLFVTFVVLVGFTLKKWNKEREEMISRCYTYDKESNKYGSDIIDCYGYISIHDVDGHYSIKDLRFLPGIPIVVIYNLKQFRVINDKMYVIDKRGLSWYVKNNKLEYLNPATYGQLPKYIIFSTQTGDTEFYDSIDKVPVEIKSIFEELSKYNN
jgi:hypothetical protein